MRNQEEDSAKEILRKEKLKAEEASLQAKDKARAQAYLAKEQELEKAQKIKDAKRAEQRASQEMKDSAEEKSRKEAYLDKERKNSESQAARRLKDDKIDSK